MLLYSPFSFSRKFFICLLSISVVAFTGCAASDTSPQSNPTPVTSLTLSSNITGSVTTAQVLSISVSAPATGGAAAAGTVVLSSGSYASLPVALSNGQAVVLVPASLLAIGADTITATYVPTASTSTTLTATLSITVARDSAADPALAATSTTIATANNPFRALQTANGSLLVSFAKGIQVFTPDGNGSFQSSCKNMLRTSFQANGDSVFGINLFPTGDAVAASIQDDGVLFYPSVTDLIACNATGTQVSQGALSAGEGSFDVTVTPDGKYAFVANEYGVASGSNLPGNVGVVSLQYDSTGKLSGGTLLGQIATSGRAIAGVTLSHDGHRLYVTSEIATTPSTNAGASNPVLTKNTCVQAAASNPQANGLLTVIDVSTAETNPGPSAVIATVNSGCSPVRTVETSDGNVLWLTARGDNRVLAFSTGMLEKNADNALLGYADSGGDAPVGLQLFDGDKLLAVANSNRFSSNGSGVANATILSVAIPATAKVLQTISVGTFPREITLGQDRSTLFLTNYGSSTLQVIKPGIH